jgi:septum site-determining protein MinC
MFTRCTHNVKLFAVIATDENTRKHVAALGLLDTLPAVPARPKQGKLKVAEAPAQIEPAPSAPVESEGATADSAAANSVVAAAEAIAENIAAKPAVETEPDHGTDGMLIKKRVRGGQMIQHPGHIVIVGDVNPGAQIVAGGDIIVWGKLQGSAHAGAFGDTNAVICALELTPAMIKIAELAIRNHRGKAEMARIKEQEITFTKWDNRS